MSPREALETLGQRLRFRRKMFKLSQEQLGERAGTSGDLIAKIERGVSKRPRIIDRLARALETTESWLMHGIEDTASNGTTNEAVLEVIITTVQEVLQENAITLKPAQHARLIINIYRLATESGTNPSTTLIRDIALMIG